MSPWNQDPSEIETTKDQAESDWDTFGTFMASGSRLHLNFQETGSDPLTRASLLARLFCHAVIARLPDEALPEMCDSASNIYGFYSQPTPALELPTPSPRGQASLTSLKDAPPFQIVEE
jgi:hypothetical protein